MLLLSLLSAMAASFPRVQAVSVIEKFPTSTSEILAGWTNPTRAYAFDENYTSTSTDTAEQEYGDYGFSILSGATVLKTFVRIKYIIGCSFQPLALAENAESYVKVYNGSTWQTYQITITSSTVPSLPLTVDVTAQDGDANDSELAIDITSFLDSPTKVNSAKTRLLFNVTLTDPHITTALYVDSVSLEVITEAEGASAGPGTPEEGSGSWLQLPTLDGVLTGIQQGLGNLSQTLFSLWNDVRYSNYFKLLIVLGLIGSLGLLVSLGRSWTRPSPESQQLAIKVVLRLIQVSPDFGIRLARSVESSSKRMAKLLQDHADVNGRLLRGCQA